MPIDITSLTRKLRKPGARKQQADKGASRYPFSPFPIGWYAVAHSHEVQAGKLKSDTFFGRELILYRTGEGAVCVIDAYCPHMGAHMAHGGSVDGDTLRCPFHGFCFDAEGKCTSTPYGPPPPAARARVYPVREQCGVVLVYFDPSGAAPSFEPPCPDDTGWSPYTSKLWVVRSHPQETTENSVDLGHLGEVHGYTDVEMKGELVTDGAYLHARYAMNRKSPFAPGRNLRAHFDVHVHGLGFSYVEVHVPEYELESRLFVYSTPTDGERVRLLASMTVKELRAPERFSRALALMPRRLATGIVRTMAFRSVTHDVQQDFDIWEHKQYIHPAPLAAGDGPIGRYRRYCRQFYPEFNEGAGKQQPAAG